MRKTQSSIAGFESGGRGPEAKDCGQPQEAVKGKETFYPIAKRKKKCSPADTLIVAHFRLATLGIIK